MKENHFMITILPSKLIESEHKEYFPHLTKLKALYAEMDKQYENAASLYGFICRGCKDNCCRTRFYHHTFLEYLYIKEGFYRLSEGLKQKAKHRAYNLCNNPDEKNASFGPMCPMNVNERCIIYAHRPMICRLHGIPHELRKPGSTPRYHDGCSAFHERHGDRSYVTFDRTPLYMELAQTEKDFKAAMNLSTKIKLTIAEMLLIE
jgi:Fe-S-cluster containining protein